jgi:hypothetical protein
MRTTAFLAITLCMYAVGAIYGGLTYGLGPHVALFTIVIGFGLPVILWLLFEWVMPALAAAFMGFAGRSHPISALLLGVPLVLLFSCVSPVVGSGAPELSAPVPWLSVYAKYRDTIEPLLVQRALIWLGVYGVVFVASFASRFVRPVVPAVPQPTPRQRMLQRLDELSQMAPEREQANGKRSG